ncbi:MAG: hypothetical protein CMO55_24915 [Verrucomicrobiales bacterium]|nr:hypothetical protein [Verrucomicrobiales bacterium]
MKTRLLNHTKSVLAIVATLALAAAMPLSTQANDQVKKVKTKDHKVKVKVVGGKAKLKTKRNGKQKIKVKGWNGDLAAAIAEQADSGHCEAPQPYYGK